MKFLKASLAVLLAAEGLFLFRPEGALVHAARGGRGDESALAAAWWQKSPVHMGCSIPSCSRPATHTATYRQLTARGATWRAYGFCDLHQPPNEVTGLVYRLGRPMAFDYNVPLTPLWSEIYFLLALIGFSIWCAGMWRYAVSRKFSGLTFLLVFHVLILAGLWSYAT